MYIGKWKLYIFRVFIAYMHLSLLQNFSSTASHISYLFMFAIYAVSLISMKFYSFMLRSALHIHKVLLHSI